MFGCVRRNSIPVYHADSVKYPTVNIFFPMDLMGNVFRKNYWFETELSKQSKLVAVVAMFLTPVPNQTVQFSFTARTHPQSLRLQVHYGFLMRLISLGPGWYLDETLLGYSWWCWNDFSLILMLLRDWWKVSNQDPSLVVVNLLASVSGWPSPRGTNNSWGVQNVSEAKKWAAHKG